MAKYCLKWNEFETNIRDSFKKLREDERLFDVILATDDGQHIQAHKMVLSAGSNFFSDIFMKTNHSNMLIYLKGISSDELEPVIDFLYNGEAFIDQTNLETFLGTAKELQIKGLLDKLEGIGENIVDNLNIRNQNIEHISESENYEKIENQERIVNSNTELEESPDKQDSAWVKADFIMPALNTNQEMSTQIKKMIEKIEGIWKCKVCGKTGTKKFNIQSHAETHIDNVSHTCQICSKTVSTRHNLQKHISYIHSELFSCDLCEMTRMNRMAYQNHKRRSHKAMSVIQ